MEKNKKFKFGFSPSGSGPNYQAAIKMPHHPSNCYCQGRLNGGKKCPLCDTSVKPMKSNRDWRERAAQKES